MSESSKVSEQIEGRENRKGLQWDTRNKERRGEEEKSYNGNNDFESRVSKQHNKINNLRQRSAGRKEGRREIKNKKLGGEKGAGMKGGADNADGGKEEKEERVR